MRSQKKIISKLDVNKLEVVPKNFHVTFRYLPKEDEKINDVVGKWFTLRIIGVANNGKNSGALIEIPNDIKNIIYIGVKKMVEKPL